ncbi:MAG: HutD family protein, partial [Actinobacteria bacterium]|nr:HutD family protein [Actinomycetota bacterium]
GYDRHIMLLDGAGMTLDCGTHGRIELRAPFEPRSFSGDWDVQGTLVRGPVRDFNVIVDRARASATLEVRSISTPESVPVDSGDTCIIHVISGELTAAAAGDPGSATRRYPAEAVGGPAATMPTPKVFCGARPPKRQSPPSRPVKLRWYSPGAAHQAWVPAQRRISITCGWPSRDRRPAGSSPGWRRPSSAATARWAAPPGPRSTPSTRSSAPPTRRSSSPPRPGTPTTCWRRARTST